jgi:tRNA G18 (ribose-2'-O)-methylase SpoU
MLRITVADLDDPRMAVYRSLKASNQTRWLGQFVVEGERLAERLLVSRFPVVSFLVTDRHEPKLSVRVPDDVPVYVVPHERIDELIGFRFHRGVLACGKRTPWPSLDEIFAGRTGRATVIVCPRLSNPDNLGAIARIGDVFGIDALVVGSDCPDPLSRRVLRVSMGSVLHLPLVVSEQLESAADKLVQEHGFQVWGAVADPLAEPFDRLQRPERLAVVFGDEDRGIDAEWLRKCHKLVTIPMRPGASSLNVAAAAGILVYCLAAKPDGRE